MISSIVTRRRPRIHVHSELPLIDAETEAPDPTSKVAVRLTAKVGVDQVSEEFLTDASLRRFSARQILERAIESLTPFAASCLSLTSERHPGRDPSTQQAPHK
ncbi:hypothetical protein G9U51_07355 [Calidifontibacter sp. DB0510]|uniref:Uncharacterized protein n=1 Tax=Metallococcus carri TaxID=1656884 RepID=A0A967AYV2_9MICO|nr:hypothetical protein [Metallococcus carri]NHN55596.1 hypothetical protein [Metallococcus carri]NOP38220.1 hypothetical protein [Calidifontibacter sp. DB2511S]